MITSAAFILIHALTEDKRPRRWWRHAIHEKRNGSSLFAALKEAISVQDRLAITLRYLASGDSFTSLQYLFRISKQSISQIIPEVSQAIIDGLKEYVKVSKQKIYSLIICVYYTPSIRFAKLNDREM
ncbi:hypothetical protein NQ315_014754 [Exocentrus adspersus]|uniref:Uncharacterized protein n=1 Tax=Exocentrus adspersus TaxID=1586481 RepID=A0AAV8VEW1_9CUCU|nr:hypothetical protein NQ315_014754 [Exocentrus adspersus]